MTDLGPILVATDLSPHARHAADRAARLAHESASPLTLLHVQPGDTLEQLRQWLGGGHAVEQQLLADTAKQLQALADELLADRDVAADTRQASGSVLDEIVRAADTLDAGLLVVGARGAGFLRRLVMGSTSERLLRRTQRPLLVVRQLAHEPYRRALLALDFSPWSRQAVAAAQHVAPHAYLVLLNVFQVPFEEKLHFAGVDATTIELYRQRARSEATRRVHALAGAAGLQAGRWEARIVEGDASMRIVEHEQAHDCDLVVLGKHGQSVTEDLLLGSVTKHVLAEGSADVLVSTRRED